VQEQIRADNLCKRYGSLTAVDQASLAAYSSECVGVFGPSKAGKSVLLRLLAGIEAPDTGTIERAERRAGLACQTPSADEALTLFEVLSLYTALYDIPHPKRHAAVREALALVGLDSERNRRIETLSRGAQKLLEVTQALMAPSSLLLLDEPMAGLDSDMRRNLWEHLLRTRTRSRKTIIIATSRPEDAELCDRVALMHEGRILAAGTPAELRSLVGPEALVIKPIGDKSKRPQKVRWTGMAGKEEDGCLIIEMDAGTRPAELIRQIPADVSAVRLRQRGLDSVLNELTARPELLPAVENERE